MIKKIIIALLIVLIWFPVVAENILVVGSNTAGSVVETTIEISINNDDPFVAFQLEIQLPNQLQYVNGSIAINPGRANGHAIAASIINGNKLLIFAWSVSNTPMNGSSGVVASFRLLTGTVPGNFLLIPQNVIIGNASSQNILTGTQDGSVTIQCPDIHTNSSSLNFGEVIIGNNSTSYLTIYNYGNQSLTISDITFNDPSFSVTGSSSFSIIAGGQQTMTIQFDATVKGIYNNIMKIHSDDPDEALVDVGLNAYAYAVNELHTGTMFGYSGNTSTLNFNINNMEPFVGFQFDLTLPTPLTFVSGSAILSSRKTDHVVAANMVSGNKLRVVAFSPTNQSFSGSDGEVISIEFNIKGTGGFYSLNVNDVIIADVSQGNIISDYFNGNLEVAAPDIDCNTTLDFGDVAINSVDTKTIRIYNYGSDTLKIYQVNFSNSAFGLVTTLPLNILVGDYQDVELMFQPQSDGNSSSQVQILSNDPDEYPKNVNLSANVFMPNYMSVKDAFCEATDTVSVFIEADNYEEFVGFQFELSYPDYLTCLLDSTKLTTRAQDHLVYAMQASENKVMIFAFSPQQLPFTGNSGEIIELQFSVNTTNQIVSELLLFDPILGNASSENILHDFTNGQIFVSEPKEHIILNSGWSGISSYLSPSIEDVEVIFQPILSDLIILQNETGIYWPDQNINTIGAWNTHEGYQIKVANAVDLTISGLRENNKTLQLAAGWNLIPVLSECGVDVTALFAGKDVVLTKEVAGWNIYWPEFGINSLGVLKPGKAYFVLMGSDGTIEFPVCGAVKVGFENLKASPDLSTFKIVTTPITPITHIMAIPPDIILGLENKDNSFIAAFDKDGSCFGAASLTTEMTSLTLFGDDPFTTEKDGFLEGEQIFYRAYLPDLESEFELEVSFNENLPQHDGQFHANGLSALKMTTEVSPAALMDNWISIFPNPTSGTLFIQSKEVENIKFVIMNAHGQIVSPGEITKNDSEINVSYLAPGFFIIKFYKDNKSCVKQFVKQ